MSAQEAAQEPVQEPAQAAADFARRMVPFWQEALGSELLGAYLIGSLAHGGFSARYSDVDVALITEAGLSPQVLERGRSEAVARSADWGPKLSVFWADRSFSVGRFPPLDRIDYIDHAVVLTERECVRPARPALDEIRRYLGGAPFAGWAEQARAFAGAEALESKDRKAYLRTLLYPARLCFSWMTGRMDSNDEAVAFLRTSPLARLDVGLLERALQCRQANADPDPLFAERVLLPAQIETCAALPKDIISHHQEDAHDDPRRRDRGQPLACAERCCLPPPPHRHARCGAGRAPGLRRRPGCEKGGRGRKPANLHRPSQDAGRGPP